MARLKYYDSLEEKAHFFNQWDIRTKNELEEVFKKFKENESNDPKQFIFRGVGNASYKLYNSAQRAWITKELDNIGTYTDTIQSLIDNAKTWQDNLLTKYYSSFGHYPYDFSILSFLQHYGCPTPLQDWTYSIDRALYFCIDRAKSNFESDRDVDNYFSIYCIDLEKSRELTRLGAYLSETFEKVQKIINESPEVDSREVEMQFKTHNYTKIQELTLGLIDDQDNKFSQLFSFYSTTNLNVINQKGLFVFSNSANEPLEKIFKGKLEEGDTFHLPKITCINIHKNLTDYVKRKITEERQKLGKLALTREYIYPQEENIAAKAFENYLKR